MAGPAGLEGALAALPEGKRELARLMLAARRPVPAHPAPRSGAGPVPPTALQTRLWRRERTHPAVATGSHALRLTGPLDPRRLDEALTGVLRRHEALRTRGGGGPPRPLGCWAHRPGAPRRRPSRTESRGRV
ncbi:hypothetical protein [Streptomyces yangpuensis]|uniref:hypothetical protein n=1 Tax=Streptomyces yangpuensis TaxID=1648182 RepID=UPI0036BDA6A2